MALIITHPGSAHLDDFLSCCLVVNKSGNIKKIKRKEPNQAEIKDLAIWKLDVGETSDPDMKCFDHHQDGMNDECALSEIFVIKSENAIAYSRYKTKKITQNISCSRTGNQIKITAKIGVNTPEITIHGNLFPKVRVNGNFLSEKYPIIGKRNILMILNIKITVNIVIAKISPSNLKCQ